MIRTTARLYVTSPAYETLGLTRSRIRLRIVKNGPARNGSNSTMRRFGSDAPESFATHRHYKLSQNFSYMSSCLQFGTWFTHVGWHTTCKYAIIQNEVSVIIQNELQNELITTTHETLYTKRYVVVITQSKKLIQPFWFMDDYVSGIAEQLMNDSHVTKLHFIRAYFDIMLASSYWPT